MNRSPDQVNCGLGYFKKLKMRSVSHYWLFLNNFGKYEPKD